MRGGVRRYIREDVNERSSSQSVSIVCIIERVCRY